MTGLPRILAFGADVQRLGNGSIDIDFYRRRATALQRQYLRRAARSLSNFVGATLDALADAHRAIHGRRG